MNYDENIYNLLQQYLPRIANSLDQISGFLDSIVAVLPDISDIRKFLLWFFVFYISTKLVRWSFRV